MADARLAPATVCVATFAVAIAVGFACGPTVREPMPLDAAERYAAAVCSAYSRCGCMGVEYASEAECRDAAVALFGKVAETRHLEFDKGCFDDVLDDLGDAGCEPTGGLVSCSMFRGTVRSGGACASETELLTQWGPPFVSGGLASTACEWDVPCADHVCAEPSTVAAAGDPCALSTTDCTNGPGGPSLYCARDGVCRERVATGSACDRPGACAEYDEYCAGVRVENPASRGVCVPRLADGTACDPAETDACSLGAYCNLDGVCERSWPNVCRALAWAPGSYNPLEWEPLD